MKDSYPIVLSLTNVQKSYKSNNVLKNINLCLKENTIVSIFGKNGSGKSTLFKIMLSLAPYKGNFYLSPKKKICGSVNEPSFYKQFTGLENIILLLAKFDESYYKNLVNFFKMDSYIESVPFKSYSAGMKQKLANLYVLLSDADILIFDEPQNSLDQKGVDEFFSIIKQLKNKKTIIISTHSTYKIKEISDEVFSLVDGNLISGYEELKPENLIEYSIIINENNLLNRVFKFSKNFFANNEIQINKNSLRISLTKQEMDIFITQINKEFSLSLKQTEIVYENKYE